MRTQYTIVITNNKGKKDYSSYPKSLVFDKYEKAKTFYEARGCEVELFKVIYNGASLHHAEKLA